MVQSNVFCKECYSHLTCDVDRPIDGNKSAVRVYLFCENEDCGCHNDIQYDKEVYFETLDSLC